MTDNETSDSETLALATALGAIPGIQVLEVSSRMEAAAAVLPVLRDLGFSIVSTPQTYATSLDNPNLHYETVYGRAAAQIVSSLLVYEGVWFVTIPMPDDAYRFGVKREVAMTLSEYATDWRGPFRETT